MAKGMGTTCHCSERAQLAPVAKALKGGKISKASLQARVANNRKGL